ncbi:hypothetical protein [Herbiconiux sp. YIM B11900]|uniref:hypothetical protein n=1 Tax=Herbiconiux sp. YIM B11900 TaxID=3404131 RepID=UPI003F830B89
MTRSDQSPSGPTRRAVLHSAWAAPVVLAAIAAPAAAASDPKPTLTVFFSSIGGGAGYVNVNLAAADGTPLRQQFAIEGKDPDTSAWVTVFRPSTDSTGHFAGTIPSGVAADYAAVRVTAFVAGYGTLVSQEQPLPFS